MRRLYLPHRAALGLIVVQSAKLCETGTEGQEHRRLFIIDIGYLAISCPRSQFVLAIPKPCGAPKSQRVSRVFRKAERRTLGSSVIVSWLLIFLQSSSCRASYLASTRRVPDVVNYRSGSSSSNSCGSGKHSLSCIILLRQCVTKIATANEFHTS